MKKLVERLNYNKVITLKLIVPSNGCNARCRFCYMKSYGKNSICLDKQLFLDNFIISMTTLLDKINGKNPVSLDITGNEPTLDISHLNTGIYIAVANTENGIITEKVFKRKF